MNHLLKVIITTSLFLLLVISVNATENISANNFELDSTKGKISLNDFRGKVVMLYFGYTSCPDICPTSLSRMSTAYQSLDKKLKAQIQPLFISLDPDRDSKNKLTDYVKHFLPNMIGLTGTKEQIKKVAQNYNIQYRKTEVENGMGYVIDHSSVYFIIGRNGELFSHLLHNVSPPEIAEKLKLALNQEKEVNTNTSQQENGIQYNNALIRTTPKNHQMTAAYLRLKNTSEAEITLVGADSKIAQAVEIHEHTMTEGMMKMRQVKEISIPAGQQISFKPGGHHLMLFGIKDSIKENDIVEIVLQFSNGRSKMVRFEASKCI